MPIVASSNTTGDPHVLASTADAANPPLRLALGGTAHRSISAALGRRLEQLEVQRDTAFSADRA